MPRGCCAWLGYASACVFGWAKTDTVMSQLLDGLAASGGRALPMTESLLQRISRKDNPQVLIGAFGQRWHVLQEVSETSD